MGTKSHHQLGSYWHLIAAVGIRVVNDPAPVRLNTLQGSPFYQEMLDSTKWTPWESEEERIKTQSRKMRMERVGVGGVGGGK